MPFGWPPRRGRIAGAGAFPVPYGSTQIGTFSVPCAVVNRSSPFERTVPPEGSGPHGYAARKSAGIGTFTWYIPVCPGASPANSILAFGRL